jgi:hypothetical protein
LVAMKTTGAILWRQLNCFRRPRRSTKNEATSRAGRNIANNLGQTQCQIRRFADGIPNALEYFDRSGQTELAAQVREDLQSYQQDAASQRPWSVAPLGGIGIASPIPQAKGSRRSHSPRSARPKSRSMTAPNPIPFRAQRLSRVPWNFRWRSGEHQAALT